MKRCPKCESSETAKICFRYQAEIVACPESQRKKILPKSSRIFAYSCTKCGHIFDLTLESPEVFAPFVNIE